MPPRIDLIGKRFGRLVVIGLICKDKNDNYKWQCKCDCGGTTITDISNLKSSHTKSCGCYHKDKITKHGLWKHPLYRIWINMKARCRNKNNKNYNGRGIKVCDEWKNNFKAFYDWCIDNKWKKGLQIDRENNNKNYSPNNCRFITNKENSQNTRKSKIWVIHSRKYPSVREAAKDLNVSDMTIRTWCGTSGSHGKPPKAKPGCYAYNKY